MGIDGDDPDVVESLDDRDGNGMLPADEDGELARGDDALRLRLGGLEHLLGGAALLYVTGVVDRDIDQVSVVLKKIALEVVGGFPDGVRTGPGAGAERGGPVKGHTDDDEVRLFE